MYISKNSCIEVKFSSYKCKAGYILKISIFLMKIWSWEYIHTFTHLIKLHKLSAIELHTHNNQIQ